MKIADRPVEVQYLIPVSDSMGTIPQQSNPKSIQFLDFMCPISKEQVAQECGLQSSNGDKIDRLNELTGDYLITDLNPQALGLNLTEAEIITTEQLFGDDLNFQCYELQV